MMPCEAVATSTASLRITVTDLDAPAARQPLCVVETASASEKVNVIYYRYRNDCGNCLQPVWVAGSEIARRIPRPSVGLWEVVSESVRVSGLQHVGGEETQICSAIGPYPVESMGAVVI